MPVRTGSITALLLPTAALIERIAPRLKSSDVKAIKIFGIDDPAGALRLAFDRGEVLFVGAIDGEAVCVVSIIPKTPNAYTPVGGRGGSIWMVTTPGFSEAPVAVLRKSKRIIESLFDQGLHAEGSELRRVATEPRPVGVGFLSAVALREGWINPWQGAYAVLDTVIDRANPTNLRYARFLGFEDWGAHYDTQLGGVTLGYFRKEAATIDPSNIGSHSRGYGVGV
jgi:hypothetical protein